tara:strand:+ start:2862 stop:3443 length:582 start_codon:yes stop_codon:yes gene_type:complete
MTPRKKKLFTIQLVIFLLAISLLYITYNNNSIEQKQSPDLVSIKEDPSEESNTFENIEYKGVDLNGNRYIIKSEIANFDTETPEIINMKIMKTIFYFKDGTTMTLTGDYGTYNNKTFDMEFRENIVAEYQNNLLYADNLIYLNTKSLLTIYGNVMTESVQGNINADNVEIDLSAETLDISMFDEKQVNVNLRN